MWNLHLHHLSLEALFHLPNPFLNMTLWSAMQVPIVPKDLIQIVSKGVLHYGGESVNPMIE